MGANCAAPVRCASLEQAQCEGGVSGGRQSKRFSRMTHEEWLIRRQNRRSQVTNEHSDTLESVSDCYSSSNSMKPADPHSVPPSCEECNSEAEKREIRKARKIFTSVGDAAMSTRPLIPSDFHTDKEHGETLQNETIESALVFSSLPTLLRPPAHFDDVLTEDTSGIYTHKAKKRHVPARKGRERNKLGNSMVKTQSVKSAPDEIRSIYCEHFDEYQVRIGEKAMLPYKRSFGKPLQGTLVWKETQISIQGVDVTIKS